MRREDPRLRVVLLVDADVGGRGKETVADAGRLAYILSLISRIIEGSDLERRLEALERKLEERNASRA
jgi:hypothetical protein